MPEVSIDGLKLRNLREAKGWTQGDLAAKARIGQSHISRLESGKPINVTMATVNRLSRALGTTATELLWDTNPDMIDPEPAVYLVRRYGIDQGVAHFLRDMIEAYIGIHRAHT